MMRSRPASASATPETIVRAVPNLNFGTCAAASQTPANRMSRKPISARRVPCDAPERGSSCAAFFLPGYTHVETGRSRRHARTAVRGYLSCVRAIGQQRVIDLDARGGRVGGPLCSGPPLSEPCVKLVASHGSSSPRGRAGSASAIRICWSAVWVAAVAAGVYQAGGGPATGARGAGLEGQCLAQGCVPEFRLDGGVREAGGVEQLFPAQGAGPFLGAKHRVPGPGQLRGGLLASAVSPVLGEGRVIGGCPAGDHDVPDDFCPVVLVEVGAGCAVAEDPLVVSGLVEGAGSGPAACTASELDAAAVTCSLAG
jgi:hypothetical protein